MTFRDIPGFPGYRAGSDGSIESCWGVGGGTRGRLRLDTYRKLKGHVQHDGYIEYSLTAPDGKTRSLLGHRLVLEAFVGPRPEGMESRHLNGVRSDNASSNLRWGTHQENGDDLRRHGTLRGEKHANSKVTESDVREIRRLYAGGASRKELAERFGIAESTVKHIAARRAWRHVA